MSRLLVPASPQWHDSGCRGFVIDQFPATRIEQRWQTLPPLDARPPPPKYAEFALSILGTLEVYKTDTVVSFFDSLNPEIRSGAWEWLTPQSPGYTDPDLWTRLFETPYDDVRLRLVDELRKRTQGVTKLPAIRNQDFAPLWASVLLGVHRGGRAKRKALRQISQTIAEQPEQAEHLMPVLVVAIRSVRPAEARVGLSAILSAVAIRPELEAILQRSIPELRLVAAEGIA